MSGSVRHLSFMLAVMAAGCAIAQTEDEPMGPPAPRPSGRPSDFEDTNFYEIGGVSEGDTGNGTLRGLRVGFGSWSPGDHLFGLWYGSLWASGRWGDGQGSYSAGFDMGILTLSGGPVRFCPRANIGLEYRTSDPHSGLGGRAGVGLELGLWVRSRVELSLFADRTFAYPSGTRYEAGLLIRPTTRRFPWWPKE